MKIEENIVIEYSDKSSKKDLLEKSDNESYTKETNPTNNAEKIKVNLDISESMKQSTL